MPKKQTNRTVCDFSRVLTFLLNKPDKKRTKVAFEKLARPKFLIKTLIKT